ncbi:unnamed protein product [Spirodela intermedia]|uniref:Uncharacterized protein n=1 Tax=Spirodela intermedia TaxID=51605 RepID=A0A7I8L088_SPIIN|nr:unnamed protein product [Spirodela intermedia]
MKRKRASRIHVKEAIRRRPSCRNPADLTGLEEYGESEIDGLEGGVVVLVREQEILRLEISVHDAEGVTGLHDPDDDPDQLRRLPLAVLHDDVDVEGVLVGALDGDDVLMAREMVHYLDLPANIIHVLLADQLPLGDGLAGVVDPRGDLRAEIGGAELPLTQLPAERIGQSKGKFSRERERERQGGPSGAGRDMGMEIGRGPTQTMRFAQPGERTVKEPILSPAQYPHRYWPMQIIPSWRWGKEGKGAGNQSLQSAGYASEIASPIRREEASTDRTQREERDIPETGSNAVPPKEKERERREREEEG